MALVKCADCQAEISDQAPTCPKCGRPMAAQAATAKKSSNQRLATGVVLIAVGALAYFFAPDIYLSMGGVIAGVAGLVVLFVPAKK